MSTYRIIIEDTESGEELSWYSEAEFAQVLTAWLTARLDEPHQSLLVNKEVSLPEGITIVDKRDPR